MVVRPNLAVFALKSSLVLMYYYYKLHFLFNTFNIYHLSALYPWFFQSRKEIKMLVSVLKKFYWGKLWRRYPDICPIIGNIWAFYFLSISWPNNFFFIFIGVKQSYHMKITSDIFHNKFGLSQNLEPLNQRANFYTCLCATEKMFNTVIKIHHYVLRALPFRVRQLRQRISLKCLLDWLVLSIALEKQEKYTS